MALRSVARRIADLDAEIGQLDQQLRPLVATTAPRTMALLGIGTQHAGQLLVTVGENIDRIHSEAGFAHMCAAAPIPASSGQTNRHRLNPYGNRQANRTLHLIAVVRLRYSGPTRAYAERRRAEGMSNKDIIRCLKRYIAREVYRTLRADLAALQGD
jgi:transposase